MRRFSTLTVRIVLFLILAGHCYAMTGEQEMLATAREHFNGGRYYFASTWLERILKNYPASANRKEVLTMIVKAYTLTGRGERATPYLTDLVREYPGSSAGLDLSMFIVANTVTAEQPVPASLPESGDTPATRDPSSTSPAVAVPLQPVAIPTAQTTALKTVTTPVPPPVETSHTEHCVIAGESINRTRIDSLMQKLKKSGLQTNLRQTSRSREVFRLLVACNDDRGALEGQLAKISRKHRDAFIFRDGQTSCLAAGSFFSEQAATLGEKQLSAKGLQVKISRYETPLTTWQAVAGCFPRTEDGEAMVKRLAAKGVTATVVTAGGK